MGYDGPERRDQALTEDRVKLMISEAVQQALASHEQHLTAHMDRQFAMLRQSFADAFPGGDPHGHRIAHEKAIANATWWDKTKSDAARIQWEYATFFPRDHALVVGIGAALGLTEAQINDAWRQAGAL